MYEEVNKEYDGYLKPINNDVESVNAHDTDGNIQDQDRDGYLEPETSSEASGYAQPYELSPQGISGFTIARQSTLLPVSNRNQHRQSVERCSSPEDEEDRRAKYPSDQENLQQEDYSSLNIGHNYTKLR